MVTTSEFTFNEGTTRRPSLCMALFGPKEEQHLPGIPGIGVALNRCSPEHPLTAQLPHTYMKSVLAAVLKSLGPVLSGCAALAQVGSWCWEVMTTGSISMMFGRSTTSRSLLIERTSLRDAIIIRWISVVLNGQTPASVEWEVEEETWTKKPLVGGSPYSKYPAQPMARPILAYLRAGVLRS